MSWQTGDRVNYWMGTKTGHPSGMSRIVSVDNKPGRWGGVVWLSDVRGPVASSHIEHAPDFELEAQNRSGEIKCLGWEHTAISARAGIRSAIRSGIWMDVWFVDHGSSCRRYFDLQGLRRGPPHHGGVHAHE